MNMNIENDFVKELQREMEENQPTPEEREKQVIQDLEKWGDEFNKNKTKSK